MESIHNLVSKDLEKTRKEQTLEPEQIYKLCIEATFHIKELLGNDSAIAEDLSARKEKGLQVYGTYLLPHNGRDALLDAYEETLDLLCYLKQYLMEQEN
jgi:hypothetical protein